MFWLLFYYYWAGNERLTGESDSVYIFGIGRGPRAIEIGALAALAV